MNTAELLGFPGDQRLLIINADDYGLCHATNEGIFQLLEEGVVSSATVMMTCGWAREAVRRSAGHHDVGVHFTLTSEWDSYKWGPVYRDGDVSTLVNAEGVFPADIVSVEKAASPVQVRLELIAQIEAAKAMGLDPTHLDNHMGSVYGLATGRDFIREVFEVCAAYGLPFRIPRRAPESRTPTPELESKAQQLSLFADAAGVVILDDLVSLPYAMQSGETYETYKRDMMNLLRGLKPGVSELILHPSRVTEELQAFNPHWEKRGWDLKLFRDPDVQQVLAEEEIRPIRWAQLRDAQRTLR